MALVKEKEKIFKKEVKAVTPGQGRDTLDIIAKVKRVRVPRIPLLYVFKKKSLKKKLNELVFPVSLYFALQFYSATIFCISLLHTLLLYFAVRFYYTDMRTHGAGPVSPSALQPHLL
jgi:hypothetical protein